MNILFICTGNTCRSPMAEEILRTMAREKGININVKSAGIAAFDGSPAADNAIKAMEEIGMDISNHRASILHRDLVVESDLILTMSDFHKETVLNNFPEAKGKIYTLVEHATRKNKDIQDPFGGNLKTYENTRDEIADYIRKIVNDK